VFLAVDDVEEVVLVPVAQVLGVEPGLAVGLGEGLLVCRRSAVVALHHVRPGDDEFADNLVEVVLVLVDRARPDAGQLLKVVVDDLCVDAGDRLADCSFPAGVGPVGVGDRAGLGQPVALVELDIVGGLEAVDHLDRDRGPTGVDKAQRGEIVVGGPLRVDHVVVHRGDTVHDRDPLAFDQ
jgi:hypothetical protein